MGKITKMKKCTACEMIKNGVKSRKILLHTCEEYTPKISKGILNKIEKMIESGELKPLSTKDLTNNYKFLYWDEN